ncbi:MAG TPA: hypothetical protein VNM22_13965 [Candidatus Limnocylindrales bacterium]|nr:hypothetical protein [Candidatus Limnocylindrales bacterium]
MMRQINKNLLFWILIGITPGILYGCGLRGPLPYSPPSVAAPPSLSSLTITPNPASPGQIVTLTTDYTPGSERITSGTIHIFITNGPSLSPISFRVNGAPKTLHIPVPVNSFTPRSSQLEVNLYVKDAGGTSNIVSAVLDIQ